MPTWGEILREGIEYAEKEKQLPFDFLRRKYLKNLAEYTKRNTILYSTAWTQSKDVPPVFLTINEEDIQGFMEVVHGLEGDQLDIIIHTPGGSIESTEAIMTYLRTKFTNIRVIIPNAAMSAGTVLACGSDELIMGTHSFIGPIDPQLQIRGRNGQIQSVPAQAIIEQFEMAKDECKADQKNIAVWLPIIEQYGPALLKQCEHASKLSRELVAKWLKQYMFRGDADADEKADRIATTLADHDKFRSHGRHISVQQAIEWQLKVTLLEKDPKLQDLVLSVFHATTQSFDSTAATKIVENHKGTAFVKQYGRVIIPQRQPVTPAQPTPIPNMPPAPSPTPTPQPQIPPNPQRPQSSNTPPEIQP